MMHQLKNNKSLFKINMNRFSRVWGSGYTSKFDAIGIFANLEVTPWFPKCWESGNSEFK